MPRHILLQSLGFEEKGKITWVIGMSYKGKIRLSAVFLTVTLYARRKLSNIFNILKERNVNKGFYI